MKSCDQMGMQPGSAVHFPCIPQILNQGAPEIRLPDLIRRHIESGSAFFLFFKDVFPFGPVEEPVRSVHLILIEKVGQLNGQLIGLDRMGVPFKEALQGGIALRVFGDPVGDMTIDSPEQWRPIKGRGTGNALGIQHRSVTLPDEGTREQEIGVCADAEDILSGEPHTEPLPNPVALNQNDFLLERGQGVGLDPAQKGATKILHPIGVDHGKARGQFEIGIGFSHTHIMD